jgi:hypothetical protein
MEEVVEGDLSLEGVLTLVALEHGKHIIFTSRDKGSLGTGNSCHFSSMSFQNETKVLLLIPNVNSTVGTSRVADTIFIEACAGELGLLELGAEGSVLE